MLRHTDRFTDADQIRGPWISAENYFKIDIGQNGLAGDYRLKLKNPGRNFQNVEFQLLKKSPSSSLKGSVSVSQVGFDSKMDRKYIRLYFSLESILKNIIKPLRATRQENDKHYHGAKSITIPILRFMVVNN